MEIRYINNDIELYYVSASSFPDGIMAAHQQLHSLVPPGEAREYYGVSRPEGGKIQYKAGVSCVNENLPLPKLTLLKGRYISNILYNYMEDPGKINAAFEELLKHPDLDPQGYCVEEYTSDTQMCCMVRLVD